MPNKIRHHRKPASERSAKPPADPPRPPAVLGPAPEPAEFRRELREHLAAELNRPSADDTSRTNFDLLSEKIVEQALEGKKDFVQIVLDRLAGRTPAAAGNEDEQPTHIEYVLGLKPDDVDDQTQPAVGYELSSLPTPE